MRYSFFAETQPEKDEKSREIIIDEFLTSAGVPEHFRGYQFLRDALSLALDNEDYLFGVTKNLYPTIAKNHRSTPARVERSIRHAIEKAWNDSPDGRLRQWLNGRESKPTNREFLIFAYKQLLQKRP